MSESAKVSRLVAKSCILFPFLVTVLTASWVIHSTELISADKLFVQDFAYHLNLFREFLREPAQDFYSAETQLRHLQTVLGRGGSEVVPMPVGWSPAAFLLFAPLALLPLSFSTAYLLWMGISGAVFSYGVYSFLRTTAALPAVVVSLLAFFCSDIFFRAVTLGQLSIFGAGLLLWWASPRGQGETHLRPSGLHFLFELFALVCLSLKPLYLLLALALGAHRMTFRRSLAALTAVVVVNSAVLLQMGSPAPSSYVRAVTMYSSGQIPQLYTMSIALSTLPTLSGVGLSHGIDLRFVASRLFVACSLLLLCLVGSLFISGAPSVARRRGITLALGVIAATILPPYLGRYDDLILFAPVVVLLSSLARRSAVYGGATFVSSLGTSACWSA